MGEQQPAEGDIPSTGSTMERRVLHLLLRMRVRAPREQHLCGGLIANSSCCVQRCDSLCILRRGVDIGPFCNEPLRELAVAEEDGQTQRRKAIGTALLEPRAVLREQVLRTSEISQRTDLRERKRWVSVRDATRNIGLAVIDREHERRHAMVGACDRFGIGIEKTHDPQCISGLDGIRQFAHSVMVAPTPRASSLRREDESVSNPSKIEGSTLRGLAERPAGGARPHTPLVRTTVGGNTHRERVVDSFARRSLPLFLLTPMRETPAHPAPISLFFSSWRTR
jgi:hypothetical protein